MVLARLSEQVSHPDVNESRNLPAVEREARMTNLKARLIGVVIDHQLEPSHSLIDTFSRQWEARQLEYVSPEECTSREWEVTRAKMTKGYLGRNGGHLDSFVFTFVVFAFKQ